MLHDCATLHCERKTRDGFRWCDDCTAVVLATGRPPELPEKFEPAWVRYAREHNLGKDLTRAA